MKQTKIFASLALLSFIKAGSAYAGPSVESMGRMQDAIAHTPGAGIAVMSEVPSVDPNLDIANLNELPLQQPEVIKTDDLSNVIEAPAAAALQTPSAVPAVKPADAQARTLNAEFLDALFDYHRLDGRTDGSGQTGVQKLPFDSIKLDGKEVKVDTEDGMKNFLGSTSKFLGGQSKIDLKPAPKAPDERDKFRKEVAQAAAKDIKENVQKEFDAVVDSLQSGKIKDFVKRALKEAQPEFWRAPSSSSGKYHPADEINYAGLLVHTIRNVMVGRMLATFFGLAPARHDVIAAALLLHDVQKGGIPWKHDNKPGNAPDSGYVQDHGPVAAEWLKKFQEDCGADCKDVAREVGNHMAQWNKPKPTPPSDIEELIVSYADYLASRDNIYVNWKSAVVTKEQP